MHIYYVAGVPYSDELYHHGTKGMRWGQRLYQYEDGTLTPLGKIHYGVQKVGEGVTKGVKATGRAVGKVGKAVAKYEVEKFKRKHPWTMNDEELDAAVAKAKKIEALSTSREVARGKTFAGKLSKTLWSGFETGVGELTKSVGVNVGKKFADELFKSEDAKKAEKLRDKTKLRTAKNDNRENKLQMKKNYDSYKARKSLYDNSKRLEAIGKVKTKISKNTSSKEPKIGSKKAVDDYVSKIVEEEERLRRKALYGPGGTAYR